MLIRRDEVGIFDERSLLLVTRNPVTVLRFRVSEKQTAIAQEIILGRPIAIFKLTICIV